MSTAKKAFACERFLRNEFEKGLSEGGLMSTTFGLVRDSSHSASWCSLLFNFGEKSSLASYHRSPTERSKRRSLWEISNPQCKHGRFLTQPLEINFGLVEINLGL